MEKLADPNKIMDPKERGQVKAARGEIERRANIVGQPEAIILLNEIKEKETTVESSTETKTIEKEGQPQTVGEAMEYIVEEKGGATERIESTVEKVVETSEKETVKEAPAQERVSTETKNTEEMKEEEDKDIDEEEQKEEDEDNKNEEEINKDKKDE